MHNCLNLLVMSFTNQNIPNKIQYHVKEHRCILLEQYAKLKYENVWILKLFWKRKTCLGLERYWLNYWKKHKCLRGILVK